VCYFKKAEKEKQNVDLEGSKALRGNIFIQRSKGYYTNHKNLSKLGTEDISD